MKEESSPLKKIVIVIGTRPELIKVACIIREFINRDLRDHFLLINTSQHKDLLDPYWKIFGLEPDVTLDVMRNAQNLSSLTTRVIMQFQEYLESMRGQIAAIMAQGDTTTVFGVSLVAFYNNLPFYHLEAGLRSFDLYNPYPEEFNRKATSIIAGFHFCPTDVSRDNLLSEGIPPERTMVVGNTVIDALTYIRDHVENHPEFDTQYLNEKISHGKKIVLITCHRRENHGSYLLEIIQAVHELATENQEIQFIWTLHPNPNVKEVVKDSILKDTKNVILVDPVDYKDLIRLLSRSIIVLSDSGGIQEEAPSFNVPVLVLRKTTERPEGITAGAAFLVGTDKSVIKQKFSHYLDHGINLIENPYGDGLSSVRVVNKLLELTS